MATVESVLSVLIKQLAASDPKEKISRDLHNLYEEKSHKYTGRTRAECCDLIASATNATDEIKIIIDGLDEAETEVQEKLIVVFEELSCELGKNVKILIACRPHLKSLLTFMTATISVSDHNERAIEVMVSRKD